MCGPEDLNGIVLAYRICKRYRAVPLPLWWPAVAVCLKALHKLGFAIVKPDQLTRLIGEKTGTAESGKTTRESVRRFPELTINPYSHCDRVSTPKKLPIKRHAFHQSFRIEAGQLEICGVDVNNEIEESVTVDIF